MLKEDKNISQVPGEPPRRWFSDEEFDLVLFGEIEQGGWAGFQLCYDKRQVERALTWSWENGYQHYRVDTGEMGPYKHMSPMMGDKTTLDIAGLRALFAVHSARIDPQVRQFVLKKLDEYLPE